MNRVKRNRRPVGQLHGIGTVYFENDAITEVAYDLTITQEFVTVTAVSPPQEIAGRREVEGKLTAVGAGVIPLLRSAMVLELEDRRKLDFYVAHPVPNGYEYEYQIKGSGWLRDHTAGVATG